MHEGTNQRHVVHRIGFFDKSGAMCALLSQTDIVRFLAERLPLLGPLCDETIEVGGGVGQSNGLVLCSVVDLRKGQLAKRLTS